MDHLEPYQLLEHIRQAGLVVQVVDGDLHIQGPSRAMTPQIVACMRERKLDLVRIILSTDAANSSPARGPEAVAGDASSSEANALEEYMQSRRELLLVLGIQEDAPGEYDDKATISGGVPPLRAALTREEWLRGLNWHYGLRCGEDGHQCQECKGVPCVGTTEWAKGKMHRRLTFWPAPGR